MPLTNPNLGNITNANVVQMNNVANDVDTVIGVWSADPRYSGEVAALAQMRDTLRYFANQIAAYVLVQGT